MMVVVDASVIAKWYMPEIHSLEAEFLIANHFELHSPELAIPEFGNILWKKCRLGELSIQESLTIVETFLCEGVTFHPQSELIHMSVSLANATGQSVHDCIYLTLAMSLDCQLITADRKFFIGLRSTPYKKNAVWIEQVGSLN